MAALRRPAACALVGLLARSACQNNSEADAIDVVEAYLFAAAGDEPDGGWSRLTGEREALLGTRKEYLQAVAESSWDGFRWDVVEALCDDGACNVWLAVPSDDSIPRALRHWVVRFREDDVPPGANAVVVVSQRGLFGRGVVVGEE